jgi:hypothetical protein
METALGGFRIEAASMEVGELAGLERNAKPLC